MNFANYLQKTPYFSFLINPILFLNNYYKISICKNLTDTKSEINTNLCDLFWFVVIYHYIFEIIHILSNKIKNSNQHQLRGIHDFGLLGLLFTLIIYSIYFYFTRTGHVTNQPWKMFFINIIYFLINIASSVTLSLFEFALFFSEGLIMM